MLKNIPKIFSVLENASNILTLVQNDLEYILQNSESEFLLLSKDFQTIYSDTESFKQSTIKTVKEIAGIENGSLLEKVGEKINNSIIGLKSYQDEISSNLNNINNSLNYFQKLGSLTSKIKNIGKNLNIIAINIGIESSRSEEYENVFSLFRDEIKKLANMVSSTTGSINEDIESAKSNQSISFNEISKRQIQLGDLSSNAEKEVQNGLIKIETLVDISVNALNEAGKHSQNIKPNISKIVESIQYHDISRQQIEHIIKTVKNAKGLCHSDLYKNNSEKDLTNAAQEIHLILNIQVNQLSQVVNELQTIHNKITQAFKIIESEIELILGSISEIKNNDNEVEDPFNTLKSELRRLGKLINQGHEINTFIVDTTNKSSKIVSSFSNHLKKIEDISVELHIKAINAVILSMRLGEKGKALAILAQRVTEISKGSKEFVHQVLDILKVITELAEKMIVSSSKDDLIDKMEIQSREFTEGIEFIDDMQKNLIQDSSLSYTQSNTLKKKISKAKTNLHFLADIITQLEQCVTHVKIIINELHPFLTHDQESTNKTKQLTQQYTMDIERNIHHQTVNNYYISDKKNSVQIQTENSMTNSNDKNLCTQNNKDRNADDFGDNVELF